MNKLVGGWKKGSVVYAVVALIWVGYVLLIFMSQTADRYNLGSNTLNLIRASFALPLLAIWLIAARAAVRFRSYAGLIDGSPESVAYRRLSIGLFFLLAYLISIIVVSRLTALFAETNFVYPAIFIKNHMPVLLLLGSFIELYRGAVALADSIYARPSRKFMLWTTVGYLAFTTMFVALFFSDTTRHTTLSTGLPAFAVPHGVLLFTLVLPSLIAWFLGMQASVYLRAYVRRVRGRIYASSVRALLFGINATAGFAIMTELLVLNASHLQGAGVNGLLLIVYVFLVLYAVGAVFVARSAAKLTLIEVAA